MTLLLFLRSSNNSGNTGPFQKGLPEVVMEADVGPKKKRTTIKQVKERKKIENDDEETLLLLGVFNGDI